MPDSQVAAQAGQGGLVEDLGHQAEILVDHHTGAIAHRDARRLLAAMLEGIKAEIGQIGDLFARSPDAEDAAGILRARSLGIKVVAQPAVASGHYRSLMLVWTGLAGITGRIHTPRPGPLSSPDSVRESP